MTFTTFTKAFAGGVALSAMMAGAAFADPALIYDLGGKFDKSFNESAHDGAEAWKKETGSNYLDVELQNDAQREQALRRFASQGANPIVMMSFMWETTLAPLAAEFPKTNFVVIDAVVDAPNVQSIRFDEHTGSYLVGALAAMKSDSGTYGFIGGMDSPLIHRFYCGYAQGVRSIKPDAKLIENYVGTTPAAWNDPVTAGELAKAAMDAGAEVVFAAAGGSGLGVLQAMADAGKYSIGVDSNQNYLHPGSVLTSMEKRVDNAVIEAFKHAGDDATFKPGKLNLGLQGDFVGYALDQYNKDLITPEMITKVEAIKADILSGKIVVHDYETDNACPL